MNSGHPPSKTKDSGEPLSWKLRPTLQLKIKANSWNEFRPTPYPHKIQVNPSAENSDQLLEWIQANPLPPKGFRWTLQLKIKANSSAEN